MNTDYLVFFKEKPFQLIPGSPLPEQLLELLNLKKLKTFAYITAYNPNSLLQENSENVKRQESLKAELVRKERWILPGYSQSKKKDWEREESFFVAGISLPEAMHLAYQFSQNAILFGELEGFVDLKFLYEPCRISEMKNGDFQLHDEYQRTKQCSSSFLSEPRIRRYLDIVYLPVDLYQELFVDTIPIFVYGTLRAGEVGNRFMKNTTLLESNVLIYGYELYSNRYYPYAVPSEDSKDWIRGDIYLVSHETLYSLDEYEGIRSGEYKRIFDYRLGCYLYIAGKDLPAKIQKIPSGDWRERNF